MELQISVIIPVYARQESAVRAIRSVVSQSGPWIELIVVDDASPEPFRLPPDLAKDQRIRVIRLSANSGASAARNAGVALATGNWLAFLDSDDTWLPGKIEHQVDFVIADQKSRPDPLVLYCTGFRQIGLNGARPVNRIPISADDPIDFASGCWFAPGSTALISKAAFQVVGGYDTSLRRLEDLDWSLRLGLAGGRLAVAPFVGASVIIGHRPSFETVDRAVKRIEAKWSCDIGFIEQPSLIRSLRAYLNVERAAACHYVQNYRGLLKYLARSLVLVPRNNVHLRHWWIEQKI